MALADSCHAARENQRCVWLVGAVPETDVATQLAQLAQTQGFVCSPAADLDRLQHVQNGDAGPEVAIVLPPAADGKPDFVRCAQDLTKLRQLYKSIFTILFDPHICADATLRLQGYEAGARMISDHLPHVEDALSRVARQGRGGGQFACPTCELDRMTEDELHMHHPLYHTCEPNCTSECPICGANGSEIKFPMHLHNHHGPVEEREPPFAPYAAFSWTVCRRPSDGRFLMVNEPAAISRGLPRYWLPAGRVDVGESLVQAAARETLEEGGVEVRITGVLRFMMSGLQYAYPCPRIVFLAEPVDEEASSHPKSIPDWESAGAFWVDADAVDALPDDAFRARDPADFFPIVASGQLKPQPVDTDAFRQFDELITELTKTGRYAALKIRDSWAKLREVYPAELFHEH